MFEVLKRTMSKRSKIYCKTILTLGRQIYVSLCDDNQCTSNDDVRITETEWVII